jgi:hypothetical protein
LRTAGGLPSELNDGCGNELAVAEVMSPEGKSKDLFTRSPNHPISRFPAELNFAGLLPPADSVKFLQINKEGGWFKAEAPKNG